MSLRWGEIIIGVWTLKWVLTWFHWSIVILLKIWECPVLRMVFTFKYTSKQNHPSSQEKGKRTERKVVTTYKCFSLLSLPIVKIEDVLQFLWIQAWLTCYYQIPLHIRILSADYTTSDFLLAWCNLPCFIAPGSWCKFVQMHLKLHQKLPVCIFNEYHPGTSFCLRFIWMRFC